MKKIAGTAAFLAALLLFCGWAVGEKVIVLTFAGDCTLGTEERTRNAPDSFDSVAKEKGLEPLADFILQMNATEPIIGEAAKYVDEENVFSFST